MNIEGKRTRAERKAARNAEFARRENQRIEFERRHPVLSGVVKVTQYVPPSGNGRSLTAAKNSPASA